MFRGASQFYIAKPTVGDEMGYHSKQMSERERNKLKQRRYRKRHASRLALERELQSAPRVRGRRPAYRVLEYCHAGGELDGLPACVVVRRMDEPLDVPSGWRVSTRWVVSLALSLALARKLAAARRDEIYRWCGGRRPRWFCCRVPRRTTRAGQKP
jgi:hypothetical protein